MNTRTDVANAALAYLGEMRISDIDDPDSQAARTCKQFLADTIDEILRTHPWSCAIRLATLTEITTNPDWGYEKAFQLPPDCLRLLQINGQEPGPSQQYYDIQGSLLLSNWKEAHIRYVKRIDVPEFDALLAKAIALQLAMKICIPLSLNMNNLQLCSQLFQSAIGEAKRANAIEKTTNANRQWGRMMGTSPLVNCRNRGYASMYRYGYYGLPIGPY